MLIVIVAAIQICAAEAITATVSWGDPCSAKAKTQIEKCLKEETADIDKCCRILRTAIQDSCPCWVHAVATDKPLAIVYFDYCQIYHPPC